VQIRIIKTNPVIKVDKKIGKSISTGKNIDIVNETSQNEINTPNTGGIKPAPSVRESVTGVPTFITSTNDNAEKKL